MVGSMCDRFVDMIYALKTQVENGLCKIFGFLDQTVDVNDQAGFSLKYLGLHNE